MRFVAWNVRRLYREVSLTTATRELDLVDMQEIKLDKGGAVRAGFIYFFLWRRKRKASIGNRIF